MEYCPVVREKVHTQQTERVGDGLAKLAGVDSLLVVSSFEQMLVQHQLSMPSEPRHCCVDSTRYHAPFLAADAGPSP